MRDFPPSFMILKSCALINLNDVLLAKKLYAKTTLKMRLLKGLFFKEILKIQYDKMMKFNKYSKLLFS